MKYSFGAVFILFAKQLKSLIAFYLKLLIKLPQQPALTWLITWINFREGSIFILALDVDPVRKAISLAYL